MDIKQKKNRLPNRRVVEMKNNSKIYGKVSHVSIFDTITPIIIGPPPYYNTSQDTQTSKSSLRMVESASPIPTLIPVPIPILLPTLSPIPTAIPKLHCSLTILSVTYITTCDSVCKKQRLCEDLSHINGTDLFLLDSYQKEFPRCRL
jgi:hypothetical protein